MKPRGSIRDRVRRKAKDRKGLPGTACAARRYRAAGEDGGGRLGRAPGHARGVPRHARRRRWRPTAPRTRRRPGGSRRRSSTEEEEEEEQKFDGEAEQERRARFTGMLNRGLSEEECFSSDAVQQ